MTQTDHDPESLTLVKVPPLTIYGDIYSPFQYPWFCINYFIGIWLVVLLVRTVLSRIHFFGIDKSFNELSEDKKRNVLTYVMQLIITSMVFVLQVVGSWEILFLFEDSTSQDHLDLLAFAGQSLSVLYVWELIYREKIGLPLLIHHLLTLSVMQLLTASSSDTSDLTYLRLLVIFGFYASTEQVTFIALFCFRLNIFSSSHAFLFYAATAQAFILKTLLTAVLIVYYCIAFLARKTVDNQPTSWKWFWKVCFIPLVALLYVSQMYACKILWSLRCRCRLDTSRDRNPVPRESACGDDEDQKQETVDC
jgi:hypothetical protein